LLEVLKADNIDINALQRIVDEINRWQFTIDKPMLDLVATNKLNSLIQKLARTPADIFLLHEIESMLDILRNIPVSINYWKAQNIFFNIGKKLSAKRLEYIKSDDNSAKEWIRSFDRLGDFLKVKVG